MRKKNKFYPHPFKKKCSVPLFIYKIVAHFTMRTYGVNQEFRFDECIWLHRKSGVKSDFFQKKPVFTSCLRKVFLATILYKNYGLYGLQDLQKGRSGSWNRPEAVRASWTSEFIQRSQCFSQNPSFFYNQSIY